MWFFSGKVLKFWKIVLNFHNQNNFSSNCDILAVQEIFLIRTLFHLKSSKISSKLPNKPQLERPKTQKGRNFFAIIWVKGNLMATRETWSKKHDKLPLIFRSILWKISSEFLEIYSSSRQSFASLQEHSSFYVVVCGKMIRKVHRGVNYFKSAERARLSRVWVEARMLNVQLLSRETLKQNYFANCVALSLEAGISSVTMDEKVKHTTCSLATCSTVCSTFKVI